MNPLELLSFNPKINLIQNEFDSIRLNATQIIKILLHQNCQ